MLIHPPRFTEQDLEKANDVWGANCGPGALAAILGLTLEQVRPHLGDFEKKGYTNPTLMFAALRNSGVAFRSRPPRFAGTETVDWPHYGLCRVQWEGPWTEPNVPIRARYRHTHWIGACASNADDIGVFDVNCLSNGSGWIRLADWTAITVPFILHNCEPKASGQWHLTQVIEVER